MGLSSKALLVNLQIRQCAFRRLDKVATATVETTHVTGKKVGNYTKKLLPGAKELDEITRLATSMRAWFYQQTLPWFADGTRILKTNNYLEFTTTYRAKRTEYNTACDALYNAYPTLVQDARQRLGGLFYSEEYPNIADLKHAFGCELTFMPVPDSSDFRVELAEDEKQEFLARMREVETTAVKECWQRLHDVVEKAVVKLNEPDAVFRDTLIGNIEDTCALLTKLNVTDDSDIEDARLRVQTILMTVSADSVRSSPVTRRETADKLADIKSKMSVFMGG